MVRTLNLFHPLSQKLVKGVATWKCSERGQWEDEPDFSQCRSLDPAMYDLSVYGKADSTLLLNRMNEELKLSDVYGADVVFVAEKLHNLTDPRLAPVVADAQQAKLANKAVLETVNTLLQDRLITSWNDLTLDQKSSCANKLIESVEHSALALSEWLTSTETMPLTNLLVEVGIETPVNQLKMPVRSLYDPSVDSVQLPMQALQAGLNTDIGKTKIIFASYGSLHRFMTTDIEGRDPADRRIVSRLMTLSIASVDDGDEQQQIDNLDQPILMTFVVKQTENLSNPTCAFWRRTFWSTNGCQTQRVNATHAACSCQHLTTFAVLMDVRGDWARRTSDQHRLALTFLTCVGCVVSSVALALALLALNCLKAFSGDRATVHKNLCFCLLLAEMIFLLGIARTETRLLCGIVAGLLHYFFLASFAWMFLEGFQLYVLLVEVFQTADRRRRKFYYSFGYGMPLIIVAVSAAVDRSGYGTDEHCWLNTRNYFVFSFVGPVIVVLLANFVFLLMALVVICKHSRSWKLAYKADSVAKSNVESFANRLKAAFVLVFLLGLTWTFGLFYVSDETKIAAYLFTVLNSAQGLFIFVFHILLNENMQNAYRRWLRRSDWLPDWMRSSALSYEGRPAGMTPGLNDSTQTRSGHGPGCCYGETTRRMPSLLECFCSMSSSRKKTSNQLLLDRCTNSSHSSQAVQR